MTGRGPTFGRFPSSRSTEELLHEVTDEMMSQLASLGGTWARRTPARRASPTAARVGG